MRRFQTWLTALTDVLFLPGVTTLTFQGYNLNPQGCLTFDRQALLSTVRITGSEECRAPLHCAWICRKNFRCRSFNVRFEAGFGGAFCDVYSRGPSGTLAQQGRCAGFEVKGWSGGFVNWLFSICLSIYFVSNFYFEPVEFNLLPWLQQHLITTDLTCHYNNVL